MSVGRVEDDPSTEPPAAFADELESDERVVRAWEATDVRWANQWGIDPETRTQFAATDRRVLFATESGTNSIGYNHVRAVETDSAADGLDLSVAFVACGGFCLLVGLAVAVNDLANGAGLVLLSVMLLVAGNAFGNQPERTTVTLVIDNERQRLSFSAPEASVGEELSRLAEERRAAKKR